MSRNNNNCQGRNKNKRVVREQPRKDSKSKRINEDNARISKVEEDIKRDSEKDSANDIGWYNKNPELLRAAGSFPFASILGTRLWGKYSVPGIMEFGWCPTIGGEKGIPVNQAFNSMYSFIVHANSRNYKWNAPDGGLLIIAGSQVFAAIAALTRAYGTVKYYAERNLYVPDALLQSQGFNPDDLRKNLGQLWFTLNNLIDQTRQIWIPLIFPVIDRWIWLNSMIFTDAPGVTSQSYIFTQNAYFAYDETESQEGGMLIPIRKHGTSQIFDPTKNAYNVADWVGTIQDMIDKLIESEDRGIIFGDILNAYGPEKIRSMTQIPVDYVVVPTYNAEVLMQVENVIQNDKHVNAIGQTNNRVVVGWNSSAGSDGNSSLEQNQSSYVLNFHIPENPTPEQVMIATRLMSGGYDYLDSWWYDFTEHKWQYGKRVGLDTTGSEIVNSIAVWNLQASDPTHGHQDIIPQCWPSADENVARLEKWLWFMTFDWHPFLYKTPAPFIINESTGTVVSGAKSMDPEFAFGDYDNYTLIQREELRNLHRVALFSEWGVPHI